MPRLAALGDTSAVTASGRDDADKGDIIAPETGEEAVYTDAIPPPPPGILPRILSFQCNTNHRVQPLHHFFFNDSP